MRVFNITLILFLVLSSSLSWGKIPLPEGVNAVWVGDSFEQNGVPMRVQSFYSNKSVTEIINYYQNQWSSPLGHDIPGYVTNQVSGWNVISRLENGTNRVVQVKPREKGGSEGYLSEVELNDIVVSHEKASDIPRVAGSDLISVTSSNDSEKMSVTAIFSNEASVEANANFYSQAFKQKGWSNTHSKIKNGNGSLMFNGPDGQADIAIGRDTRGLTIVFVNYLRR